MDLGHNRPEWRVADLLTTQAGMLGTKLYETEEESYFTANRLASTLIALIQNVEQSGLHAAYQSELIKKGSRPTYVRMVYHNAIPDFKEWRKDRADSNFAKKINSYKEQIINSIEGWYGHVYEGHPILPKERLNRLKDKQFHLTVDEINSIILENDGVTALSKYFERYLSGLAEMNAALAKEQEERLKKLELEKRAADKNMSVEEYLDFEQRQAELEATEARACQYKQGIRRLALGGTVVYDYSTLTESKLYVFTDGKLIQIEDHVAEPFLVEQGKLAQ